MRCAVLALSLAIGCGPNIVNDKLPASVSGHLPATLEAARPRPGDPRDVHVRVWVDAGVRALPHWRERIVDQLDYASQLLTPLIGARLSVDKIGDWNRTSDPSAALSALAEVDKGDNATWVIGYVTPGDRATKVMSDLGQAEPLGKYVIVRGWSERAETQKLTATLPDMREAQRTEILAAHRRHKQAVVLLHMLATTLGAIDSSDASWIQNRSYSSKQSTFSDRNRELMQLALEARLADTKEPEIASKLLAAIEKSEFGGWVAASRDEVTKRLRNIIDATKAGRTAKAVPAAAYDQYSRIETLAKQGQFEDALIELSNLLTAYPGNAAMHQLRCEIMLRKAAFAARKAARAPEKNPKAKKPDDTEWRAACAKASELAPGDPSPHLAVAKALAARDDIAGTRAELVKAEDRIANLPAGAAAAWRNVIDIYMGLGALTWSDAAIARAKLENDPVAEKVAQKRARYGVPRGAKFVKPAHEGELVHAVRDALDLVYAAKFNEARRALAVAERHWPGAPGLSATRCDLGLRTGQLAQARAACAKALAIDPGASWALYLSGVMALRTRAGTPRGIEMLKKAIAVDPELGQAWRALAQAYARETDNKEYRDALEQLAKDYQTEFGQSLPR